MGLDSFWYIRKPYNIPGNYRLCGGMFSGPDKDGCNSFRGKVYADVILAVTNVSLYQEEIQHHIIVEMAEYMVKTPWDTWMEEQYGCTKEEWTDLVDMFDKAANDPNSPCLVGWW